MVNVLAERNFFSFSLIQELFDFIIKKMDLILSENNGHLFHYRNNFWKDDGFVSDSDVEATTRWEKVVKSRNTSARTCLSIRRVLSQ